MKLITEIMPIAVFLCLTAANQRKYNGGTKTTYDWSFTDDEMEARNQTTLPAPSSCRPLYIGNLLRHGTRNPSYKDIINMRKLMKRIGGEIQSPEFSHLNQWTFPFFIYEGKELISVGYREHVGLGRRWASRVRQLLEGAAETEVKFSAGKSKRTSASAEAFMAGMAQIIGRFGNSTVGINNTLTRYSEVCNKYSTEVDESTASKIEKIKWFFGEEVHDLKHEISRRLDLGVHDLRPQELYTLFVATIMELVVFKESPWWNLWPDPSNFDILDYTDDLKVYYEKGYAYPITMEMSCVVLEQIFGDMDLARSARDAGSSSHPKAHFMFSHSTSIVPLLSLLGLFNDSTFPILADNYDTQANRTFRSSRITPMAVNIGFVLYQCEPSTHNETSPNGVEWPPELSKYMIQVLFKEMSIKIPGSCGYDICPYEEVRSQLSEYIDNCNFWGRCTREASESSEEFMNVM